ncbi:MAG TPA: hypothetical protein VN088_08510 [Nocardioides sp.]|nr:hypothetical protein [Nocardioides sp.]
MATYIHDPDDRLDYAFDWTSFLAAGETITGHTVTGDGVTADSDTEQAGIVTYWVSGGVAGTVAHVTCHVTTSAGRQKDATDRFIVREM